MLLETFRLTLRYKFPVCKKKKRFSSVFSIITPSRKSVLREQKKKCISVKRIVRLLRYIIRRLDNLKQRSRIELLPSHIIIYSNCYCDDDDDQDALIKRKYRYEFRRDDDDDDAVIMNLPCENRKCTIYLYYTTRRPETTFLGI